MVPVNPKIKAKGESHVAGRSPERLAERNHPWLAIEEAEVERENAGNYGREEKPS